MSSCRGYGLEWLHLQPWSGLRWAESATEVYFELGDEFFAAVWLAAAKRSAKLMSAASTVVGELQPVTPIVCWVEVRTCPQVEEFARVAVLDVSVAER